MIYAYTCIDCKNKFEVTKSVKDMEVNEFCPRCDSPAERQFVPSILHITGSKVQHAEWNPGLGCVVKNKEHRKEICKRRGLIEVGSDWKSGEKMSSDYEKIRNDKREKSWGDV